MLTDSTIGSILHFASTCLFAYYTLWIVVSPFVDANHFTQIAFPPREYGIAIPAVIVLLVLIVALTTASLNIIASRGRPTAPQPSTRVAAAARSKSGEPRRLTGPVPLMTAARTDEEEPPGSLDRTW